MAQDRKYVAVSLCPKSQDILTLDGVGYPSVFGKIPHCVLLTLPTVFLMLLPFLSLCYKRVAIHTSQASASRTA